MARSVDGSLRIEPLNNSESLLDRVTSALRDAIVNGQIQPGTQLSVPELARQLNVSRTPAREALLRLQSEGLVDITPRRGAVVIEGQLSDLDDLFRYREPLEGMGARLAAVRMSDVEKVRLRAAFDAHADAVRSADLQGHITHDASFHELFLAGAKNRRIAEELGRVRAQLTVLTRTLSAIPGGMDQAVVDAHEAILTAIERGDGRAAETAARAHVRGVFEFYLDNLR